MAFRPPAELREAIERWAKSENISVSEALRRLLEAALEVEERKAARREK